MDILDALNDLMAELEAEAASEFAAADRHKDEAYGLTSERLCGRGEGIDYAHEKLRKLLAAEPEPAEATAEMAEVVFEVDVEPDGEGDDIPEDCKRRALYEHLRQQHGQTDLPAEHLLMLIGIHSQQPHGRGPGRHRVSDHDRVRDRAVELYRAARERTRKAVRT